MYASPDSSVAYAPQSALAYDDHQYFQYSHPCPPAPCHSFQQLVPPHLPSRPPCHDHQQSIATPNPVLENQYCSDYTCCGLSIPNLHALIAHQACHPPPPAPPPIEAYYHYASPSPQSSAPSSPRSVGASFSVTPTSMAPSPHLPFDSLLDQPYAAEQPYSVQQQQYVAQMPAVYVDPTPLEHPLAQEQHRSFPSVAEFCPSMPYIETTPVVQQVHQPQYYALQEESVVQESVAPAYTGYPAVQYTEAQSLPPPGPIQVSPMRKLTPLTVSPPFLSRKRRLSSPSPVSANVVVRPEHTQVPTPTQVHTFVPPQLTEIQVKSHTRPPANKRRKNQLTRNSPSSEKPYKCPREGCKKAYLNPNGLGYHLKKGTCEYE